MDNFFEQAAEMARMQAAGYAAVRERARNEALEECAKLVDDRIGLPGQYVEDDDINADKIRDDECKLIATHIRALKTMKEEG